MLACKCGRGCTASPAELCILVSQDKDSPQGLPTAESVMHRRPCTGHCLPPQCWTAVTSLPCLLDCEPCSLGPNSPQVLRWQPRSHSDLCFRATLPVNRLSLPSP